MPAEGVNAEVKNAALIGAIEIMVSPEYGSSFLREAAGMTFPADSLTDEILAAVDEALNAKLMELGKILFAELDESYREPYRATFADVS